MTPIAHVLQGADVASWWIGALIVGAALLSAEHVLVKHGGPTRRSLTQLGVTVAAAAALVVGVLPAVDAGQRNDGLPDLISDPPRPAFFKEIFDDEGDRRLVVTFDGYIHNIGDGPLDVVGNPQLDNGMVQRVRVDGEWQEVGFPTVYFETDDGHNHFHLIEAIDYVLWHEDLGGEAAVGSKVGFCLVDSEQMEPGSDQAYSEELDNFCQQNNPGATSLRMGISAGWRDIYDATTTLQWVDVSDTAPGRYWIGAVTDANDEILESNEENNALIFATRPAIVPGWVARPSDQTSDGGPVTIELDASRYGTVSDVVFTIVEGPASGVLDVPVGASILDPAVQYTPDASFVGTDRIVVSARDFASPYPTEAPTAEITIEVTDAGAGATDAGIAPALLPTSTFFEMTAGEPFETEVFTSAADGGDARLFGIGLPSGLAIEGSRVTGAVATAGFFDAELVAVDATGATTRQPVTFIVNEPDGAAVFASPDRSSPFDALTRVQFGPPRLGAVYDAFGLPPGLALDEIGPIVSGVPSETGTFDVEIRQTNPDDTIVSSTFTWTIRPAVAVRFAL